MYITRDLPPQCDETNEICYDCGKCEPSPFVRWLSKDEDIQEEEIFNEVDK